MKRKISIILTISMLISFVAMQTLAISAENESETMSLAEIYEDYFLVGAIFSPGANLNKYFDFMKSNFNVLTAENAMKPDAMQRSKGKFNFADVDKALDTILDAGLEVHGHTLSWHAQSPAFLNTNVTRAEAEQNLSDHILNVAGHYAGKVISWDVLNEAMIDNPPTPDDWRSALRHLEWYNSFAQDGGNGEEYIYMAFKLAREADPNAILYYNDYNLVNRNKALAVYNMVKELNETYLAEGNDRLLIDGVGMQGHYSLNTNISDVEESLKLFSELGVEVSISELDVAVSGVTELSEDNEFWQAVKYAQLFKLFKKYSDVIERVTLWGLNDEITWIKGTYPMLFNADFSPKMAYFAVADPDGFLEENNILDEIEVKQRLAGSAAYGTPEIDGKIDDIWKETEVLPIDQMLQAWITASGTARVMWDEENLYVLVEAVDPILDNSADISWNQDSVEIFIDERNCKRGSFLTDDSHYRVCFDGTATFGTGANGKSFVSAVTKNDSGYTVEMMIPFKVLKPQRDTVIGFDTQINDARNGAIVGVMKWCDPSSDSKSKTTDWGEIIFTGGPEPIIDENTITTEQTVNSNNNDTDIDNKNSNDDVVEAVAEATEASGIARVSMFVLIPVVGIVVIAIVIFMVMRKKGVKSSKK